MATLLIDPKLKYADLQRKAYTAGIEIQEGERAAIFRISTVAVDREKEVIIPRGIDYKAFRESGTVLWAHLYNVLPIPIIGKPVELKIDEKGLISKVEFAETDTAQDAYKLAQGGFLRSASIGFLPIHSHQPTEKDLKEHPEWAEVRTIYDKVELLEFSLVPVPSNREALMMAVSKGAISLTKATKEILGFGENPFLPDSYRQKLEDKESIETALAAMMSGRCFSNIDEAERMIQTEKVEREKLDGTIRKQGEIIQQREKELAQAKTDLLAEKVKRSEQKIQHEAADAGIEKLIDGVCALIRRKTGSVS